MSESTIGHITSVAQNGTNTLTCNLCGNTESIEIESNKHFQKFTWLPFCDHGKRAYVKCEKCGKLHEEIYKHA